MKLGDIDVLVLDCQATASNPENGHLLEMGWTRLKASVPAGKEFLEPEVESHLARLPDGQEIPRRVTRITGLNTIDMAGGETLELIWQKLSSAARQVAEANHRDCCPTAIHYARFEEPHLRHLFQRFAPEERFPFDIICTYEVMRRLVPELPRKGLRAAAGYLGYSTPELRRSHHHVAASAFVWNKIVPLLEEQGVETLDQLRQWLNKPVSAPPGRDWPFLLAKEKRAQLPDRPGIYRFLRSNGDLLYIGKATSLKKRVNSYFHKKKASAQSRQTLEMLTQAAGLEVIETGSALEAALLETDLIKQHAPPYNVALRQRERHIAFFSRDLRQFSLTHDPEHPVGPLPSAESLTPFAAIDALLKDQLADMEDDENTCCLILGVSPDYAPGIECFREGVTLFREQHREWIDLIKTSPCVFGLMQMGMDLQRWALAEQAAAESVSFESDEEEHPGEREEEGWTWSPEAVVRVMKGIIRHGSRLVRRSRWFRLLGDSVLTWKTGTIAGGGRRLLVLQDGMIVCQETIKDDIKIPEPPGYQRTYSERASYFDIATYDRLRVLTTELRRITAEEGDGDRDVQLCLSPDVVLKRKQLRNVLPWI